MLPHGIQSLCRDQLVAFVDAAASSTAHVQNRSWQLMKMRRNFQQQPATP
jgi:hypothetical protein